MSIVVCDTALRYLICGEMLRRTILPSLLDVFILVLRYHTESSDYIGQTLNATIPAGETSANFTETIGDDAVLEGEELFNLALSIPPFPASLGIHSTTYPSLTTISWLSSLLSPATMCMREQVKWSST